ncbi:MAG: ABC transporter substrate-binding protein, partial [Sediminibacterium sp.]|nr:ABC transporter substrate-binding protein [Sediminibacterium sp.]
MKVCSFLPAATQTMYDLGLQDYLYGVSFECPPIALQEKKVVVRCILEGNNYSSEEINTIFSNSVQTGKNLYYLEDEILQSICPDLIITQDTCEICLIDTKCVQQLIPKLIKQPAIISISPNTLQDVLNTILIIGEALNELEKATLFLSFLSKKINTIQKKIKENNITPKKILFLEWLNPFFNCGHWIPNQIEQAGGIDLLGVSAKNSYAISFNDMVKYDPAIIIIAPCGFNIERTEKELFLNLKKQPFYKLQAVQNNQLF